MDEKKLNERREFGAAFIQSKRNEQWKMLVLSLKETAEKKGITQQCIAEQSGLIQSNISRFFALKYRPTLDTFLQVANALGIEVSLHCPSLLL